MPGCAADRKTPPEYPGRAVGFRSNILEGDRGALSKDLFADVKLGVFEIVTLRLHMPPRGVLSPTGRQAAPGRRPFPRAVAVGEKIYDFCWVLALCDRRGHHVVAWSCNGIRLGRII